MCIYPHFLYKLYHIYPFLEREEVMENKNYLNTQPDSNDIWKELGGNYENAEQSINELVDNAISNILGNNTELKKVQITLEETNDVDQAIIISIEDSGLGIKDAGEALTLGKAGSDSVLNEHGFGLIQALSAANKENDAWEIFNRSPENKANQRLCTLRRPMLWESRVTQWSLSPAGGDMSGVVPY